MRGNRYLIQAVGMDKINQVEKAPKARSLVKMFPGAGQDQARAFNRPYGTVHLPLGMASCSLKSRDGRKAGDLRLNRLVFHLGCVLTGRIPNHGSSGSNSHAHINNAVFARSHGTI